MKMDDVATLTAHGETHDDHMKHSYWAPESGKQNESWTASLIDAAASQDEPRDPPRARDTSLDVAMPSNALRLDDLARRMEQLRDAINQRLVGSEDLPGWLLTAAGNPHTYDARDPSRVNVCGRLLPSTYERLKAAQRRLKLRSTAGTWEFLLRLGLAAADRLPTR